MIRKTKSHIAAFATVVVLVAVGTASTAQAPIDAVREVRFFNWADFVDPQTIEGFEREFGIRVIVETFADENEAVSVIQADTSRYDLFVTSTAVVREMVDQRLLARLDHANIPNLGNIDARFLDLPFDPGNEYSVPYDWGTTGLGYNTDCVTPDDHSWGLLLDPRATDRIAMDTDFRVVIASMLKYHGHPLNSTDRAQLAEAMGTLDALVERQGLEFVPWDEILDRLSSGDLCVAQVFNGDVAAQMMDSDNVDFFVPREGSDYYVDSLAIPRDARNKPGAEAFINYILRPDVHAANNVFTGYAVPNRASIEGGFVSDDQLSDPVRYPDTDGLETWVAFDLRLRTVWNEAWSDFVIRHG